MESATQNAQVVRFATFEVDLRTAELRKGGLKLKLGGQPFQVLSILLERPGEVMTREELQKRLWPTDTFVDFDHGVNTAINRMREALGDSADNPRFIETLPRRGYRFIAPIESIPPVPAVTVSASSATPQAQPAPLPETDVQPRHAKRFVWILAAALLLGLLAANVGGFRQRLFGEQPRTPIESIAVLPLMNLSNDVNQDYFADGMTEALTTDLGKISALRVISRTSAMQYKGTKKALPEIARELNVDAVVEGSVLRSGQRVRITAQLLQASADRHLWAETYDRDLGDLLRLQSEVAQAIAEHVRAQLTPRQQAIFRSARPVNPEAYEDSLRGRYYLDNQFSMAGPLKMAKNDFEESVRKDRDFALGYSGLALAYILLNSYGNGEFSPDQAYRLAKEASEKSLQLDDSNGEAHYALALISFNFEWDFKTAERELDDAIALAPSYAWAHECRGLHLSILGRRSEALEELANIGQLDPGPGSMSVRSAAYYHLRDYQKLIEVSRKGVTAYPNEWENHRYLGIGYEATGQREEAITEYQKAVQLSEGNLDATAFLAHAYAEAGRRDEAEKILARLMQKSKTAHVSPYFIGTIYAGLHDNDRAFAFLEKAYQEKSPDILWHLTADVRVDNLHSDPRFQDLLRRMNFPD